MARQRRENDSPAPAIGYIRVSEVGGRAGPELHTLDVQRASIEAACARHRLELVDVLTELNRSGADAQRPVFREAMRRIEAGEARALVVWKVSRFSRDLGQAVLDARAIEAAGADLIAGDEPFDTASPQGTLMLHLLLAFADYEREVLKEQWDGIKRRVIERGSHLGRTPLGYLRYSPEPSKPWHVDLATARRILRKHDWTDDPSRECSYQIPNARLSCGRSSKAEQPELVEPSRNTFR